MRVIYGQRGHPVGSIDGDAVHGRTGEQIAFLADDHIYHAATGEWVGSLVNGVVYNAFGAPQGFTEGASDGLPFPSPRLRTMLPPRLLSVGVSVSDLPSRPTPDFLISRGRNSETAFRDGYFA
jgi:hypothetical protein